MMCLLMLYISVHQFTLGNHANISKSDCLPPAEVVPHVSELLTQPAELQASSLRV